MTKKIKLETETETDFDFHHGQIESYNFTLTSIRKRLETMQKRLYNLELHYKDINDKQLCKIKRYKGKNKK